MTTLSIPDISDEERRTRLYSGQVLVYSASSRREAPNVGSGCTGTSLRDFLRARDFERIAQDLALTYKD